IKGYGLSLIVKKLTADGVKPWGYGKTDPITGAKPAPSWSKAYVHKIIGGGAVLGEYQPMKDGKPDGDRLPDYYPAVVDDTTWQKAQAALARRKDKPGRIGEKVASLFTGLLFDAQTQSKMLITWQTRGHPGQRSRRQVLVSADSMEG